jgi:hypothetical protein
MSVFALVALALSSASAQNIPPPGAYQPIPNFTGVGAGLQFREAINNRLSGTQPILPMVVAPSFANLPAEQDGVILYCNDCKRTTPCGNGGEGAWALGTRGQWSCTINTLESSLNANGNKVTSLANGTVTGDALSFGQTSGGDLGGSLPNPVVSTVLGGQVPVSTSTALTGGDLSGTLPAPTVQTVLGGKAPVYSGQTGAQVNTMAGAKIDGSDMLNSFSVNGTYNVTDFGATGSGVFGTDDASALQRTVNAACLGNNVSDAHVSATTVLFPPGSYKMTYPLWVNCAALTLQGSGMYSSALSPTYDFGPTVAFAAQAYAGIPLATRLLSGDPSTYNSFDFTADRTHQEWINLREWDGVNGPAGLPSGMNLNGLPAFTVELFFTSPSPSTSGVMVGSGSIPSASVGQVSAFSLGLNSGQIAAHLHTTGGNFSAGFNGAPTANTTYYAALTYDGSHLREYFCLPGASNCNADVTVAVTGTIVQDPTEDVDVGAVPEGWPDSASFSEGAIDGKVYSVRVSNIARYTGTIATVPSAAFTGDSNTLILTNGEQAPGGAPFIKAYDTAYASAGYGWLFGFNTNRPSSGNYFIELNGMRQMGIRPGGADTSGVMYVSGHDSMFDSIAMQPVDVGFETFNLAYENRFSNITVFSNGGRYGIADGTGLNSWSGTKVSTEWACEVAPSGTYVNPICIQGNNTTSRYGFVQNCISGGANGVTLQDPVDDAEDSGNPFTSLDVLANSDTCILNVTGGNPQAEDSSAVADLDSGGTVNFFGTLLTSNGGSPTQIIQATGTVHGTAVMTSPTFSGWGSAPLSSTAGAAEVIPCKGQLTLSSGSATFSNVCVTTTSVCAARDATTPSNAVTLGVPSNGSILLTGTNTDAVVLSCN